MKTLTRASLCLAAAASALAAAGCVSDIDAGGHPTTAAEDDDPLAVEVEITPGSLDDIHQTVLVKSCAGQPGLCHNGQFEPNLSTPAMAYATLARRPSLERTKQLRVVPGDPAGSLLMDKLRNKDVISQMPLGAQPLSEEDIAKIEKWIQDGALRRPGDEQAPTLNNPPAAPQGGVFDSMGARLDVNNGPATVAVGATITLRMAVQDFEIEDAAVPFAGFVLQLIDGKSVVLNPPSPDSPNLGPAVYDGQMPPEAIGDVFNWRYDWLVPDMVTLVDDAGMQTTVASADLSFSLVTLYVDGIPGDGGMLAFGVQPDLVKVTP